MSTIQFIEQNGIREYAIIPMDLFETITPSLEELEEIAELKAFNENDDGFRIPSEVAHPILDGMHPIKAWRRERNLTQEQLSKKVGISKAYLSQIENYKRDGTLKNIRAIAKVLKVNIDDLED